MKKFFVKIFYKKLIGRIFNPFLGFNIKPMPLEIKKTDTCLVIAPHPDDESIGCGGILSLYPENFEVFCLTHGEENSIRAQEMDIAMKINNIKYQMFDFEDKQILRGWDKFKKFNISKFDYIFIPYIFDQHKDHKAVSVLLSKLLNENKHKKDLKIAFYEVWSTINMPQYYINITSVIETKKQMINSHKSQIATRGYADKIIGLNSYRGLLRNIDAVESFAILNVSDFQQIVSKLVYDI